MDRQQFSSIHDNNEGSGLIGSMNFAPWPAQSEPLWRVVLARQTYWNLLYLLLSFVLGIIYFVLLTTGLAVGIGLLIIWVGVPILVLVMAGWWYLAAFERRLAIEWLHVSIPPMALPLETELSYWERLRTHLSNPMTWKTLAYLLLRFPLGIFAFVVVVSGFTLAVTLVSITFPLVLLVAPFVYLVSMFTGERRPWETTKRLLLLSLVGFGLAPLMLSALNALAFAMGELARVMLGMSDKDLRLAESRVIVERERAKAASAERSRHELIVNVSHDLRTPIASIRGHIESLVMSIDEDKDNTLTPEDLRPYLGIVHREVERLSGLVEDLFALARTEADQLHLSIEPVAADQVLEEVHQALAPLARRERQVTLVYNAAPGFPLVLADRQRLAQVLLNLVRNAITYTPQGGIVSLSIEQHDPQHLALVVADTGIGIAPEDLARVFERFYRADASRTRSSGGFGLGLAIVRDLVHAMGGSVLVASKVNEGSSFRVILRIA